MARFSFRIGTSSGGIQTLEIDGDTREAARRSLEAKGVFIFPEEARPARQVRLRPALPALSSTGIKPRTFLVFNQELLALVKAGLPIITALDLLGHRTQQLRLKSLLQEVREAVRAGTALSVAMSKHPRAFPPLYTAALHAGEQSGNFVEALGRYVDYQKRMMSIRQRFRSALTYPAILIFVSTGVVLFLLTFVVPSFTKIYSDVEAELPAATQMLVRVTGVMRDLFPLLLGLLALLGVVAWQLPHWPAGRRLIDRSLFRSPWLRQLVRGYLFSRFARTLAMTLAGGIPMIPALETSLDILGNLYVTEAIRGIVPQVAAGNSLESALAASGVVPPLVLELVAVGETSGSLGEMLGHAADLFDTELDSRLATFAAAIEPLIMIGMGLVVATIVVIMYLPIFHLSAVVR
jgi:type IV pilus assembly protein PilC